MELIKKKKRVVVRILKKDVADLIAAGHESSGFGRMDTLIAEINLASCYETIEKLCECILSQLPTLQKQRECPEECKEAISTLIYAAARFSDLPELRDLRSVFVERYGSRMESSVNAEFAEKTKRKAFSREWKLKAMQDIADEFSISWRAKKGEESCNLPSPESVNQTRSEQVSQPLDEEVGEEIHERIEGQNIVSVKPLKPNNAVVTQPYGKQNEITKTRGEIKNEQENNVIHEEMPTSLDREDLDSYMALGYGKFLRRPSSGDKGQERGDAEANQDERDEEEKILDDLLLYYSRKGTDNAPTTTTRTRASQMDDCERDIVKHQHGNREGHQVPRIKLPPPKRTSSLPLESASPAEPDTRSHCRGRVHPRLPDYDQLAAMFAALKNGLGTL